MKLTFINRIKEEAKAHLGWTICLGFLFFCILVGNLKSATLSGTIVNNSPLGTNIFNSNGIVIYKITLTISNTASSIVGFFDSPYDTNRVNLPAYTNAQQISGTFTTTYTNIAGALNTNTITYTTNQQIVVAAAAQQFRQVASITHPGGGTFAVPVTITYVPSYPLIASMGLSVTNAPGSSNLIYSIEYLNLK